MRSASRRVPVVLPALVSVAIAPGVVHGSDCSQTSVGLVPLSDLGPGTHLGRFVGGLYPNGANVAPPGHHFGGLAQAQQVRPRNAAGEPAPNGSIVLLSIGMSNTTQEFCSGSGGDPCTPWSFMGQASADPAVDESRLAIVNGALGGQAAATWNDPADPNYDRVRDTVLAPLGLTEAQVQAVWVKVANPAPTTSLPAEDADAYALEADLGAIARAVRVRYPNCRLMFASSRIYAGYASTPLNPEPFAYESGFAVKWAIEAQIAQAAGGTIDPQAGDLAYPQVAPWIGWGPYLWADGLEPRSDGLVYACADLQNDGTHPATGAEAKVGTLLLEHFLTSPYSRHWFRADRARHAPDLDGDGVVDFADLLTLLADWGPCPPAGECENDIDGNGIVGFQDLLVLLESWSG